MIQQVMSAPGGTGNVALLYSAKHSNELLFKDTFDMISTAAPRFQPSYFVTGNESTSDSRDSGRDSARVSGHGGGSAHGTGSDESIVDALIGRRIAKSDLETALEQLVGDGPHADQQLHVYMCGP
jgi:hypothetical protein